MTPPLESSLELELCPFIKKCNPEDNQIEDYCCLNYEECPKYIESQKNEGYHIVAAGKVNARRRFKG